MTDTVAKFVLVIISKEAAADYLAIRVIAVQLT